jgi:hypothetical protein
MNDAHGGIGVLDGTAYLAATPYHGGLGAAAVAPAPALEAAPAVAAFEPTLESRLFDGGFITRDQLDEIAREQALSARPAEEIVRERAYVAPGIVDRLLGRVPPPAIGSFELAPQPATVEPQPAPAVAADPLPVAQPRPELAFDLVVTLRAGTAVAAPHDSLAAAQAAARTLVGAGADEWLAVGAGYVRGGEAVAVEVRPRLLS